LEAVVSGGKGGPAGVGEVGADAEADNAEDPEEDAVVFHAGVAAGEPGFFVGGGEAGEFEFGWGCLVEWEEMEETEMFVSRWCK